jgi:hypothetical protein
MEENRIPKQVMYMNLETILYEFGDKFERVTKK